jgi:regulator of protease activity HflC (stomatin/prohibitin superfamily)
MDSYHNKSNNNSGAYFLSSVVLIFLFILGFMVFLPQYGVYHQRLEGEAELAKAQYSKQVSVQEAQAKKDSASLLAEAEVARAEGVAKANAIIGNSLKDNEAYLRYLYIQALENKNGEVIYVPTEAGLPILEAGRLKK